MNDQSPTIVWFRQDLRVSDHPALQAASQRGCATIALYVLDDDAGGWAAGAAARWWLHHSLQALASDLDRIGLTLTLRRGPVERVLTELIDATGASAVFWNRCYEPFAIQRDASLKRDLKAAGVEVRSFNGSLLLEPWEVMREDGTPFSVYSPFARVWRNMPVPQPAAVPEPLLPPAAAPVGDRLEDWALLPTKPDWAGGLRAEWQPGAAGARARLHMFLERGVAKYGAGGRHRPDRPSTSRLSPHLHWGEISPREVWQALEHARARHTGRVPAGFGGFAREIIWREFAYHLLYHHQSLPERSLDSRHDDIAWRDDPDGLRAWQRGLTGYPMVDAGMRELWHTGWMHNRLRMLVASFLTKDLLLPWQAGAAWFWDTLVDADLANNTLGWQWSASAGPDSAPYLRIANPVTQGEKFDPEGAYVRRFVPELQALPTAFIHKPWEAPAEVLRDAQVVLGETYPRPIVDHGAARVRALSAYQRALQTT